MTNSKDGRQKDSNIIKLLNEEYLWLKAPTHIHHSFSFWMMPYNLLEQFSLGWPNVLEQEAGTQQ